MGFTSLKDPEHLQPLGRVGAKKRQVCLRSRQQQRWQLLPPGRWLSAQVFVMTSIFRVSADVAAFVRMSDPALAAVPVTAVGNGRALGAGWQVTDWFSCTPTGASVDDRGNPVPQNCIGGFQKRNVTCASELPCEDPMPQDVRFCVVGDTCGWNVAVWSACSATECGQNGGRKRTVQCVGGDIPGACPVFSLETSQDCFGWEFCNWFMSEWTACTAGCGSGQQQRTVACADSNGCPGRKPPSSKSCTTASSACPWTVTDWGLCNVACGNDGVQSRDVVCNAPDGTSCSNPKPAVTQRCIGTRGCGEPKEEITSTKEGVGFTPDSGMSMSTTQTAAEFEPYSWFLGDWGDCSSECGLGMRSREVFCGVTCSVYRCPRAPYDFCTGEQPDAEMGCYGKAAPWFGTGAGGDCLVGETFASGRLGLLVNRVYDFAVDPDIVDALRKAIFELIGSSISIVLSMISVTVALGRRLRPMIGRRLARGLVTASYTVTVPAGTAGNVATDISNVLQSRSLSQVSVAVERQVSVGDLARFGVQVSSWIPSSEDLQYPSSTEPPSSNPDTFLTLQFPSTSVEPQASSDTSSFICMPTGVTAARGCLPGASGLDGCGPSCTCCVPRSNDAADSPLQLRTQPGLGPSEDNTDATESVLDFSTLVGLGSALVLLFFCAFVFCVWRSCASARAFKKKHSTQMPSDGEGVGNRGKRSRTVPVEIDTCSSRASMDVEIDLEASAEFVSMGPPSDRPHSYYNFEEPPEVDKEPPEFDEKPPEVDEKPPRRSRSVRTDSEGWRSDSTSMRKPHRSSSTPSRRSMERAREREDRYREVYAGMSRTFHEKRASPSHGRKGSRQRQTEWDGPHGGSGSPQGAQSPSGRNTKPSKETAARDPDPRCSTDSGSHSGQKSPKPNSAAGGRLPQFPENETEQAITAETLDEISKLDSELEQTRCKDLEWRRRNFKCLLLKWHPDKNCDQSVLAGGVFRHLMKRREAYLET